MRYLILALLFLAACSTVTTGSDVPVFEEGHGDNPDDMPTMPLELTGELTTQNVEYFEGVTGYEAKPAGEGPYPGIVLIHEWWGLNDNIKMEADRLANEGYHVLAVDLFKGGVADTPDGARELVGNVVEEEAIANMQAATQYLRNQGSPTLASMGWCFGGAQSLNLALAGEDLDATVIYYGRVTQDEETLATIDQPVLGIFGEEDTGIPADGVREFQAALDNVGVENDVTIYPGVGHAFANPDNPGFAMEEAEDAWQKTLTFLDQNLRERGE